MKLRSLTIPFPGLVATYSFKEISKTMPMFAINAEGLAQADGSLESAGSGKLSDALGIAR